MKCEFCGGVVSWVGNLIDNPSTQCAGCGRRNCQEVEPIDTYQESVEMDEQVRQDATGVKGTVKEDGNV